MKKFHNVGISRTTGIEYTTSVIEAVGVEHKETTRYVGNAVCSSTTSSYQHSRNPLNRARNYDILAAVFTDIVKFMHQDFGLAAENKTSESKVGG
jgi:hypothetical protein